MFWCFLPQFGVLRHEKEILLFARLYRAVHRWRWALSDVEIKAIAKANEIGIWPSQPS